MPSKIFTFIDSDDVNPLEFDTAMVLRSVQKLLDTTWATRHSEGDGKSVARPIKTEHAGRQNPRQSEAISGEIQPSNDRFFPPGNPAIPRVMANRSRDRLKPKLPRGKTLGNLRPFPGKSNPRNDRFFAWVPQLEVGACLHVDARRLERPFRSRWTPCFEMCTGAEFNVASSCFRDPIDRSTAFLAEGCSIAEVGRLEVVELLTLRPYSMFQSVIFRASDQPK
ncbi:hypothetical protein C8J57DRAFT_1259672 [Mycena rebaudengoi]|nr:hypothetical protein C8J57DRAFT_1259672 [Mycena rebaudengoi]